MNLETSARIASVIFDMDGVLTDSEPLINEAAVAMFKERGLTVQPEDFLPFVGAGEDRYIGGVAEKYSFQVDLAAAKHRTYEIYLELVPGKLEAFPGAVELVRSCRQAGLRVAVASSADRIKVTANLAKIGLPESSWDAVVTGEDVIAKKPAPDIFLKAAERLGTVPAQCMVVEDAVNGVQAAKAAGMRCVAIAGSFPPEKLAAADLVVNRISQLTVTQLRAEDPAGSTLARPLTQDHRFVTEHSGPPPLPGLIAPEPEPFRPWPFWPTSGFGLLILGVWMGFQGVVAVACVLVFAITGGEANFKSVENLEAIEANGLLLSLAALFSAPIPVFLSWLFTRIRAKGAGFRELGFRPVRLRELARWTVGLAALILLSDLLTWSLGRPIVPDVMKEMYATAGPLPLFWLALVIAAPVAEEVLFRGFLLEGWARSTLGPGGAVVLTSLIWALIHFQYDAYGVATIFLTGMLLGWARLKSGSLWTTIYLHGLMNLVATLQTSLRV